MGRALSDTKLRTRLDVHILHNLLEISIEGPSLKNFDVNSAIDMCWKDSAQGQSTPAERIYERFKSRRKGVRGVWNGISSRQVGQLGTEQS